MARGGKLVHGGADLSDQDLRRPTVDARDRIETGDDLVKRAQPVGNLLTQAGNALVEEVDVGQMGDQE